MPQIRFKVDSVTHTIHVWYYYLRLVDFMVHIGRHTGPMDGMGERSTLAQFSEATKQVLSQRNQALWGDGWLWS